MQAQGDRATKRREAHRGGRVGRSNGTVSGASLTGFKSHLCYPLICVLSKVTQDFCASAFSPLKWGYYNVSILEFCEDSILLFCATHDSL